MMANNMCFFFLLKCISGRHEVIVHILLTKDTIIGSIFFLLISFFFFLFFFLKLKFFDKEEMEKSENYEATESRTQTKCSF